MNKRPGILLSAFGIHSGGGLVLLKAVLRALREDLKLVSLDIRLKDELLFDKDKARSVYVPRSFLLRLKSIFFLVKKAESSDILFCFNSLPPLLKPSCRVIVFVQAAHFANFYKYSHYPLITALRIFIERHWFFLGIRNCDELWVQNQTMARSLRSSYPNMNIRIMPFLDDELTQKLLLLEKSTTKSTGNFSEYIFFYPADGAGHKNHVNLIKAWVYLSNQGYFPNLILTLSQHELKNIYYKAVVKLDSIKNIKNIGPINREEVMQRLKDSSAMIFPSLSESFGLPMLEAQANGISVIASELDFVRDVCLPSETFDPGSPISIARAVMRFMGVVEHHHTPLSATEFLKELIGKDL